MLTELLLELADKHSWELQAWAVFSNHYHLVGCTAGPETLPTFIQELHSKASREVNAYDGAPGRQVLYQYWDTYLSFERSYYPRLRYVHENPVKHDLVKKATDYPWCSAGWFEQKSNPSFRRKLETFKIDKLAIHDNYYPVLDL